MRFLELAKQALGAVSVQSDQSHTQTDLSSHTALSSQPKAYTLGDGCGLHGVGASDVAARWRHVELMVSATPEDDQDAQWSVVAVCPCCCGPSRIEMLLCTRCDGADLDELRKTPPCADCGEPSITVEDGSWRCESHRSAR